MTAGIPGVGIGGLFYLISALLMPFKEAWRLIKGTSTTDSRRMVLRQVMLALGILASLWVTGWLLGLAIVKFPLFAWIVGANTDFTRRFGIIKIFSYSALELTVATLAAVLGTVQVLRLIVRPAQIAE